MMDGNYTYQAKDDKMGGINTISQQMQIASAAFAHRFLCGGNHSVLEHEHQDSNPF